ncbi:MAG: ABC transporter permease [Gemmatimonadaceae bacterium]|nr:ABC transporter permease [Gemmatimonadaceae bacterium]
MPFFDMATPVLPAPPSSGWIRAVAPIRAIGATASHAIADVGDLGRFTARVARAALDLRTWRGQLGAQMRSLGVDSVPIGIFIAVFTGVVLALLASYSFTKAVPLYFVGTLVEKTITLELGPVLTGLALAGRVGANIAAELGTMKVTEQVDALETLAFDPLAYLVVPRIIAGTVMFPVVVAFAMVVGVSAGWASSVALLGMTSDDFLKGVRLFFGPFDVTYGLVKAASFGAFVTLVGCREGLRTRGGAEGVGRAATRAVVQGAVLILVLDAFWAITWLLGRKT